MIFCINVVIHEMFLLQKNKGQGINTVMVIPLCNPLKVIRDTFVHNNWNFSCIS